MVVIDANIILYAVQQASQQCKRLLLRYADDDVRGLLPTHILAEVVHRLMIAEARDNGWVKGPNPARQLAAKPDLVKRLFRYEELVQDILTIGFQIEPVREEDFLDAMMMQRRFGLLTDDALSVAITRRLGVKVFASADKALTQVQGLHVYAPDDLED